MQIRHDFYIFHDETGEPGKDLFFISGLLIMDVATAVRLRRVIRQVRENLGFTNELHWVKFSALRDRVYRAVFDASLSLNWQYRCILIWRDRLDLDYFRNRHLGQTKALARANAYNYFTKLITMHRTYLFPGRTLFISDKRDRMRVDNFTEYLVREVNGYAFRRGESAILTQAFLADSKRVAELQFADLVTGAVATHRKIIGAGLPSVGRKAVMARELMRNPEFQSRVDVWEWWPYNH